MFYYAIIIHFKRLLRGAPTPEMQDIVEKGLEELEAADILCENSVGCNFVWPSIVIGSEWETPKFQRRMSTWFTRKRRLGFKNLDTSYKIVTMVCKRRAASAQASDVSWQSLIAIDGLDVFPL